MADQPTPGDADERRDQPTGDAAEEERKRRALQLSDDIARRYDPDRLSRMVSDQAGRGEKLDFATQHEMERRVGGQFGQVRVFRGPFAEAVTRRHRADAVTIANTGMILVREGPRSDPKTALGKALLAHELTHVKQAQRGLHFALEEGQSSEAPHEREAEAVESKVHAEETATAQNQPPRADPEEKRRKVKARVLEMIAEKRRLDQLRLGLD